MSDQKRGDDAEDHAPRPDKPIPEARPSAGPAAKAPPKPPSEQGAANYQRRRDDARAIESEDLNSANDE